MAHAQSLARARRLVGLAAPLVPARLRGEWRAEWEGELAAAADYPKARLTRYALGAFADAFWIRQRDVADFQIIDDLRHGFRHWRQQSGFVITAIGILALSMAASVTAFPPSPSCHVSRNRRMRRTSATGRSCLSASCAGVMPLNQHSTPICR